MSCIREAPSDGRGKVLVVLTCSCCGGEAPAFAQWPNRDRGFGLCGRCAAWIHGRTRFFAPDEFRRCYDQEGIHWMPAAAEGG